MSDLHPACSSGCAAPPTARWSPSTATSRRGGAAPTTSSTRACSRRVPPRSEVLPRVSLDLPRMPQHDQFSLHSDSGPTGAFAAGESTIPGGEPIHLACVPVTAARASVRRFVGGRRVRPRQPSHCMVRGLRTGSNHHRTRVRPPEFLIAPPSALRRCPARCAASTLPASPPPCGGTRPTRRRPDAARGSPSACSPSPGAADRGRTAATAP